MAAESGVSGVEALGWLGSAWVLETGVLRSALLAQVVGAVAKFKRRLIRPCRRPTKTGCSRVCKSFPYSPGFRLTSRPFESAPKG